MKGLVLKSNPRPAPTNEMFQKRMTGIYLHRHLSRYPMMNGVIASELGRILGAKMFEIAVENIRKPDPNMAERVESAIESCIDDNLLMDGFNQRFEENTPQVLKDAFYRSIFWLLIKRQRVLYYYGDSPIERTLKEMRKLYAFTFNEMRFIEFIYIAHSNNDLETLFFDDLKCDRRKGRKYVANMLTISRHEIKQVLNRSLITYDLIELDRFQFEEQFGSYLTKSCW